MKTHHIILSLIAAATLSTGCVRVKKPAAAEEREQWILSLNDSIADYQRQIEDANNELASLNTEVSGLISNFEHVSNPRLVEGYYIYRSWASRYPLTSTGIVARITQDEGFEIIAALTGGHFNQISVTSEGMEATSDIVPHAQALNYRAGNLNTVCFYGEKADSIGSLIHRDPSAAATLVYLNGGKTGSHTLSDAEKEMISATWQLFSSQRSVHSLERKIPMLSRRINVCRQMIEANDSTSE